jgi:predicted metal-dependent peptidase
MELDKDVEEILKNAQVKLTFSPYSVLFEKFIILTQFVPVDTNQLPTYMAIQPTVNGVIVYINQDLIKQANDINFIITILAHEYFHIINGHCWTPLPDQFLDNLAADTEINQNRFLNASSINAGKSSDIYDKFADIAVTYNKFNLPADKDREFYYEEFKKKVKTVEIEVEVPESESCLGSKSERDDNKSDNKIKIKVKAIDTHDKWKESDVQNARSFYERVVREALETAKQRSTIPGSFIEEILAKWEKCKDLERILRRVITKTYRATINERVTRLRLSRRNPLLPGTKDDYGPTFVFALDTSGSMSIRELEKLLSVFRWCCKKFGRTELIQCDADVHQVLKDFGSKTVIQVKGRGGTNFKPVFEYIAKKYKNKIDLLIYGTDLYGDFPDDKPPYNVVWVVPEKSNKDKVPFGKVVHLGRKNNE